jgi:hypothetical protein
MIIIQIVPQLPPVINGVGDYALNLARQLRQDFGIDTQFIVGDRSWKGETTIEGFSIRSLEDFSSQSLLSLLSEIFTTNILLHYVGYGYAKRGCPIWLVDSLQQWRNGNDRRQLITMFHETYAVSRQPWTSSFWLSPLQKQLAARLAQLSDLCVTSLQEYSQIISSLSFGKHPQVHALPVFSSIGEPTKVPSLAERDRRLIVFGGRGRRIKVYQKSTAEINLACKLLGITEIVDIGPLTGLNLSTIGNVPIREMGECSAMEISEIFANSLAGFFNYNIKRLAKSTIFASYCSHGILPISSHSIPLAIDGIQVGKHYWIADERALHDSKIEACQAISDNAYHWYQTHRLSVQAQLMASQIKSI